MGSKESYSRNVLGESEREREPETGSSLGRVIIEVTQPVYGAARLDLGPARDKVEGINGEM